jgi:hypothetical protein
MALAQANDAVQVFVLKNRPAQELLPKISPFLPPTATIEADQDRLIIKADPQTLGEIKKVISSLDIPTISYQIEVSKGEAPPPDNSNVIEVSSKARGPRTQSLKVNAGEMAFLSTDQATPVLQLLEKNTDQNPRDPSNTSIGVHYETLPNGYSIRVQQAGDKVRLELQQIQQNQSIDNVQRSSSRFGTSLTIALDTWVNLADQNPAAEKSDPNILTTNSRMDQQNHSLWIRVTKL